MFLYLPLLWETTLLRDPILRSIPGTLNHMIECLHTTSFPRSHGTFWDRKRRAATKDPLFQYRDKVIEVLMEAARRS